MTKNIVTLDDRYDLLSGPVFLSSLQALVRLTLDQGRRDHRAGLATAGYVTGYRGSPITTLDAQLWAAAAKLRAHDIHFEPGLNEELAATSLRGTQQHTWFGASRFQGVFAMWYAKGLGVDRACEALKLANFEGTAAHGGVLVVAGDDHAAKSSASAHQSEHTLIAGFIPILAPATTDEILAYGLLGWELSRFSGLYVALKTVTDTLDLTSTVLLPNPDMRFVRPPLPDPTDLNLRRGLPPLQQELLVVNARLPAAIAFARANRLNRVLMATETKNLTIITAGKASLDVQQALRDLGLDAARCAALGISLIKLGMVWPLDADFVRAHCTGAREVLVVEEKRPVIEEQLANALYSLAGDRPLILGKCDEHGGMLFPSYGVLDATMVRRAIARRLEAHALLDEAHRLRSDAWESLEATPNTPPVSIRPAFFCSGCPHNASTVVPEGSFAMGATGCHGLAAFMPERRTMGVVGMGAEGMPWVAAQHFVETPHAFQNLGDGTYAHSGILAVRAAVAARTSVTFKILYNDAVAMTGGQKLEGNISAPMIVRELVVEGVKPVVLVSDNPQKFKSVELPAGVRVLHRDRLDEVQRELREVRGTSAIVYEQTCANEKRRRRKRGSYPDPDLRLFINADVCEGCGDCSAQSNCVSVTPLETEFGRKRAIDQSNCNKDFSCIKGFCPSFVSVRGAKLAKRTANLDGLQKLIDRLEEPAVVDLAESYSMLVTGIGGTGVLTVGAVLGMAAHIEGKSAKVLDMTGMAQKGGGVMSHIRFATTPDLIPSARLGTGQTDLLVACDLIVAGGPDVTKTLRDDTQVVVNEDVVPTGEFQTRQDIDLHPATFLPAIARRVEPPNIALLGANALAQKLLGDTIFTNLIMVGCAAQRGHLPVRRESIEAAVRLNGTAVEASLRAFAIGRIAACFPEALQELAGLSRERSPYSHTLDALLASRRRHLAAYQDETYAQQYADFVAEVTRRVHARRVTDPEPFLMHVANQLARLMAYKDEYEVARLYSTKEFADSLRRQFDGGIKISVNLAPPLLAFRRDEKTGRPRKIAVGSWIFPLFRLLSRMKGLRGTRFDLFGHTAERKMERALISEYKAMITGVIDRISDRNIAAATEVAAAASAIAGYGPVKAAGIAAFRDTIGRLQGEMNANQQVVEDSKRVIA